jgi:DNA-binding XRE family transcriptional regulator
MSLIDQLSREIKDQFPDAEIAVRKSDDPDGFQFLNLAIGDFEVGVEWHKEHGFGISSFSDGSLLVDGMFDAPNEWYATEPAAFHRIASLIFDQRSTKPRPARISEIRQERGMSQETLSEQLNVKQATYSKLERRADVKVSSLRQVIEAMGGKLLIQAVFPDSGEVREITLS